MGTTNETRLYAWGLQLDVEGNPRLLPCAQAGPWAPWDSAQSDVVATEQRVYGHTRTIYCLIRFFVGWIYRSVTSSKTIDTALLLVLATGLAFILCYQVESSFGVVTLSCCVRIRGSLWTIGVRYPRAFCTWSSWPSPSIRSH